MKNIWIILIAFKCAEDLGYSAEKIETKTDQLNKK